MENAAIKSRGVLLKRIKKYKYFYILLIPAAILYIIFSYVPMYGAILSFKEFDFSKGILRSPWTTMHGMQHFYDLLTDFEFKKSFLNTVVISFSRIIFEFPIPIILAFLINEVQRRKFKRVVQTVLTFPHFISWVVVMGIIFNLLSQDGVINQIITTLGGQKTSLMTQPTTFRALLYITDSWKEAGWSTIIYLAAISGINISLYEAAIVDGAKRLQLARYITWPAIKSVIGILLILNIANLMSAGFDQIFNMYNSAVYDVSDIIDTFIYRRTFINGMDLASSTAIGLFKSVINFAMLITANTVVTRSTGKGIY
jgi:ABC-type polysaccharide transport system, permease component